METVVAIVVGLTPVMGGIRLSRPRHDRRDVVCHPAPMKPTGRRRPFPGHHHGLMVEPRSRWTAIVVIALTTEDLSFVQDTTGYGDLSDKA